MKAKDIVKEYCKKHIGQIVAIFILSIASLIFLIGTPVLLNYIVIEYMEIKEESAEISKYETLKEEHVKIIDNPESSLEAKQTSTSAIEEYNQKISEVEVKIAKNRKYELFMMIGMIVSAIGTFIIRLILDVRINHLGSAITDALRKDSYNSLLRGDIYEISKIGNDDIERAILSATENIGSKHIANHMVRLIYLLFAFLGLLITIFVYNPLCGLVVLVSAPVLYFTSMVLNKFADKRNKTYEEFSIEQYQAIEYNIANLKQIKIRNGIENEQGKYLDISKKANEAYDAKTFYDSISKSHAKNLINDIIMCAIVIIYYVLTARERIGSDMDIKTGNMVAVIIIAPIAYNIFQELLYCYSDRVNITESYRLIDQVISLKPETRSETITVLDEITSISFSNVSFDYTDVNKTGVHNISFVLNNGEVIGIYGQTNSGKTTILDLISKVIRPKSGSVMINNIDNVKINTKFLRDIIAYVPSDYQLFNDTIEANITYPGPIDEYKYNDALNKCKIKTLLMNLPKRDQENVFDLKLSKADEERISLAYAIYKDSPIIMLDEVGTHLDRVSKNEIMNEFYKMKNKIIIVTSSNILELSKCDKIVIMKDGQMIEFGERATLEENPRSAYSKILSEANRKANK